MFEFQANKNDPQKLMSVLERFTRWWFFAPHEDETGVSQERLDQVDIPTPLKRLYAFAGEWPGGKWESIFSHQDHLAPFELLQEKNGKLVFGWENQGVWQMATELTGEDPPVYIAVDDEPFELFCESLSQFLVTFCLQESVFGAPSLSLVDDLASTNIANGKIPIPLWLNAPYPMALSEPNIVSFYLVDGCVLQMNLWCGGSQPSMDERYPYFVFQEKLQMDQRTSGRPSKPRRYAVSSIMVASFLLTIYVASAGPAFVIALRSEGILSSGIVRKVYRPLFDVAPQLTCGYLRQFGVSDLEAFWVLQARKGEL